MGGDGAFVRRKRSGGWEETGVFVRYIRSGGWKGTVRFYGAVGENSIDFLEKLYRLSSDTL